MLEPETAARVALALIIVGVACIGIPHRLRADRAGGRVSPRSDPKWFWILMGIVGPPLVLVCVAFMIQPRWVDFARINAPPSLRLLGIPVAAAGVAVFAWMFLHLGLNVTSTSSPRANATLVTTGPYRWVRHPMYSAAFILGLAATLLTSNAVVMIAGACMYALLVARSRIEEQRLVEKFGEAYRAYQRRTGRFIPRIPRDS
ncbi:MAG: isoprenylcysteine carboxylmethyltransferase family protein [Opitutaceae bacterium]|nr:isoprenylcysteine carboxylmethyltransferase family protein [Opitutaceae bacterium]